MQNNKIKCHLIISSASQHIIQIFSGFNLLAASGQIDMTYERGSTFFPGSYQSPYLKVIINENIPVGYDGEDDSWINEPLLHWSHYYFKRSYLYSTHHVEEKIHPLGLNDVAYTDKDPLQLKLILWNLQKGISKDTFVPILRSSLPLSRMLKLQNGKFTSRIRLYEDYPSLAKPLKVLFSTKLWTSVKGIEPSELDRINHMRAACIRALKEQFGDQFVGGLYPSREAKQDFPDLVLTNEEIYKYRYLQTVKNSQICIATRGLNGSIGWKLTEYVAAAKAIVSESLLYQVPGEFLPGKNYLEFSSPEECVRNVQRLMDEPELRYSLMKNNFDYYHAYVRPDVLVWNTIQLALLKSMA